MSATILPPPPNRPYALPTVPVSAIGADKLTARIGALEVAAGDVARGLAEVESAVAIEASRVTLLVREVAKLRAQLSWRAALGSAVGSGLVALAAKLVG